MTIKHGLAAEALKLAESVRAAAEEFARNTGMEAGIDVVWVRTQRLESPASESRVSQVRVHIGGLEVTA